MLGTGIDSRWWFDPKITFIHLVRDVEKPWNHDNGGQICPHWFRKKYPESFLRFDPTQKPVKGIYKVTLVNPGYLNPDESYDYWVSHHVLLEEDGQP